MNCTDIDQEDIYNELPSLCNCHEDILENLYFDLPFQDQQQSFYESLPSEDGGTHPTEIETPHSPQITYLNKSVIEAVLSLQQSVRCTRCKVQKTMADFGNRSNGERMKICRRCTLVRKIGNLMSLYRRQRRHSIKS